MYYRYNRERVKFIENKFINSSPDVKLQEMFFFG